MRLGQAGVSGEKSVKGRSVKVYRCRVCGTSYYVCPFCGESFTTLQALGGHLRKHRYDELDRILEWLGVDPKVSENLKRLEMEPKEIITLLVLKDIRDRLERLEACMKERRAPDTVEKERPAGDDLQSLPSFARDNPWLQVLASR